ncbi:hypothetical protein Dip510_000835 [Elusimicrobium posterum]|uniref:portal protein n=1 Tax=Elusimicrobium posterum TaxID=3116653 RepID=UPI003C756BD6
MMDIERAEQIHKELFQTVDYFKPMWQDQAETIDPLRGYFGEDPMQPKLPNYQKVLSGYPKHVLEVLSSGLTGGLGGPNRPWYKAGLDDTDLMEFQPVKEWLTLSTEIMFDIYAKSSTWYPTSRFMYEELGLFGTGASAMLPDYEEVLYRRPFTIGQYALGCDYKGKVNSFAYDFYKTAEQLVGEFGRNNVSARVRDMYDYNTNKYQKVKIKYIITPNPERDAGKRDNRNMPFTACYWEPGSENKRFLKHSGFEDFPINAPRWSHVNPLVPWGYGTAYKILGDVNNLYSLEEEKLLGAAMVVRGPVQADASIKGEINLTPQGINRTTAAHPNGGIRPVYEKGLDLQALRVLIQDKKQDIDVASLKDLFLMAQQGGDVQKTAYEIAIKNEEKLLLLGPVLENLYAEKLKPEVSRSWNIAMKAGVLPPPPAELQGKEIKIEFISVLAQAQKQIGIAEIERSLQFNMQLSQLAPYAVDNTDWDEAAIEYNRKLGLSPKIQKSRDRRDAERQAQAESAAAQQNAASMMSLAQGAKTLSDTKLGQNSALDAIVNGGAAQ